MRGADVQYIRVQSLHPDVLLCSRWRQAIMMHCSNLMLLSQRKKEGLKI